VAHPFKATDRIAIRNLGVCLWILASGCRMVLLRRVKFAAAPRIRVAVTSGQDLAGHTSQGRNMSTNLSKVGAHITAAHDDTETVARPRLLPHLRWELEQVMTRVRPADLSAAEIAALLGILRLAHSRVIGGPPGRPGLRIIGGRGEQPAPKLA
jgi:hypothetical protein